MLSVASNTPTVHHHYKTISPPATNANSRSPRRLLKKVTKTWRNVNVFTKNKVKAVGNLIRKNSAQFIDCQSTSENNENKEFNSESNVRKDSSLEDEESAVIDDKSTDKLILSDCEEVSKIYNKSLGENLAEVESTETQVDLSDSKKRKRSVFGGKLANATKLLKDNNSSAMAIKQLPEENKGVTVNYDQAAAAVANVVDPYPHQNRDQDQHFWSHYNQNRDQEEKKDERVINNWGENEWSDFYTEFEPIQERPHYMSGFPNPPGENRCWLNATLHALFVLPLIENLNVNDSVVGRLSKLTKLLVAMKVFWRDGYKKMEVMHQTVKKFKEELAILDETYPEEKQQDVSEFLMILLNYVKTECEQLSVETCKTEEVENVPENHQDLSKDTRAPLTPSKRSPLAILSPLKTSNAITKAIAENAGDSVAKTQVPKTLHNPIDDCFLLPMREHYICEGCNEHRQRDIDNMMLYVPLPDNESNNNDEVTVIPADAPATPPPINLSVAINKSMEPEERCLTCTKCKSTKHHRSTSFRGCPNVLTVQINRYGVNNDGYCSKINTPVEIPAELSVEITNNDGTSTGENEGDGTPTITVHKFQPVCIIAHVGSAMDCGHYTSYAKHDNRWFHYNDMDVTPMSESDALGAVQRTAYLVFFVNVNSSEPLTNSSSDLKQFNSLSVKLDDTPLQ
ncbi:hypothetical protein G9C98_002054 [Cotesia typhae]|uniref:USP domain-containing protein n=1 Tax=Cotesia typhae TaxID=2053667 RepID=A0A8J5QXZ1_9HYME|nr:hypothetical protein G9C98_002054 [Cotesia typhae]